MPARAAQERGQRDGSPLPSGPSPFAYQGLSSCASQGGNRELGYEEDRRISRVAPKELVRRFSLCRREAPVPPAPHRFFTDASLWVCS